MATTELIQWRGTTYILSEILGENVNRENWHGKFPSKLGEHVTHRPSLDKLSGSDPLHRPLLRNPGYLVLTQISDRYAELRIG